MIVKNSKQYKLNRYNKQIEVNKTVQDVGSYVNPTWHVNREKAGRDNDGDS